MEAMLFYLFAASAVIGAGGVVVAQNVTRMAMWLFCTLGGVAALYFLMSADFVGVIQLLVYAGGTLILIVFGVMLTTRSPFVRMNVPRAELLAGGTICLLLFICLAVVLTATNWPSQTTAVGVQSNAADWTAELVSCGAVNDPECLDAQLDELVAMEIRNHQPQDSAAIDADSIRKDLVEDLEHHAGRLFQAIEARKLVEEGFVRPRQLVAISGEELAEIEKNILTFLKDNGWNSRFAEAASTAGGATVVQETTKPIGRALLTDYLLPFEVASVLLLVVMIGAAFLAKPVRR
jgi:NADH:ubiquinone oxidoreductase subunit 6 (subunit J)